MATATYKSNTSDSTTLTLSINEHSRQGTSRTFRVDWSVTLGSGTNLSGRSRTLYIYKSDGMLCGQSEIKSSAAAWTAGSTYTGSFDVTIDVGTTAAGSIVLYGMTNADDITSCTWTDYCDNITVPYSASTLFKFNGQPVTNLTFNGQPVTSLVYNGTVIY